MNEYKKAVQIRWSDLDPNFHLRHSVYYDWAAFLRVEFLNELKLTAEVMQRLRIGPVLFREESIFKKEIKLGDAVTIDLSLVKSRQDFSRWVVQHHIIKNENTLCAVLTVEGAWLNVIERKLAVPPQQVLDVFNAMPKAENFEWM